MSRIKEELDKIKWDKKENPEEYSLFYIDRITQDKKEIKFTDIKRIEGSFLVVERAGEEVEIPMHRIREIRKKGKLIWQR